MKKILFNVSKTVFLGGLFLGSVNITFADESNSMMNQLKSMSKKIEEMQNLLVQQQTEIEKLKVRNSSLEKSYGGADTVPINAPTVSRSTTGLNAFNPEIGVVADMTALLSESKDDDEGNDRLSVREVEVILGSDVDPYSRFDSTIAFSDDGHVHLEEAYLTHWGLPLDLRAKLGRLRPGIGKTLPLHRDQLELVDLPIVIQDYFGEEGLTKTALELSSFVPFESEFLTQEVKLGLMEGGIGDGGNLFGTTKRIPTYYGHLKNFFDISDNTTFELGGSYLLGSADEMSSYDVNVYGLDVTLIHNFNAINRLKLQSEFFFQDRDKAALADTSHTHGDEEHEEEGHEEEEHEHMHLFNDSPFGFYGLVDYRVSTDWGIGARYDYVEPVNFEDELKQDATKAYNAYLTFFQSEYARFRFQYQHLDRHEMQNDDRFMLQGTFAIGVHKHQLQ